MNKLKNVLSKLTNTSTLTAVASGLVIIAQQMGFRVDNDKVTMIVYVVCSIGVSLGVMSKKGRDSIKWDK